MFKDSYDKLCWLILIAIAVSAPFIFYSSKDSEKLRQDSKSSKSLERELAYRARVELINQLYAPVEQLRKDGSNQSALLKLDELIRKYPTEGHGYILQGKILLEMGAFDEALSSYTTGVKLNGAYVDAKSPLSKRDEIQHLVDTGMNNITLKSVSSPGNSSLASSRQKLNYLKSRLAGGCE